MKKKFTIAICIIIVMIVASISIAFNKQPVNYYKSIDRVASITAAKTSGYKRVKKKKCICCEDKLEKIKKAMQDIRERKKKYIDE